MQGGPAGHNHGRGVTQQVVRSGRQPPGVHPGGARVSARAGEGQGPRPVLPQLAISTDATWNREGVRPIESQHTLIRDRSRADRPARATVADLQHPVRDGCPAAVAVVARQGDRATGQLGHLTRSGNHPAVVDATGPIEGQHSTVGHVARAQRPIAPAVPNLQNPTLDRGQTAEGVRPSPSYRVSSLLRHRARASKIAH